MKNILLIASLYKQGERIYPIIPELSKHCKLSLLTIHGMSYYGVQKHWNGSLDMREAFHKKYDTYFSEIYENWRSIDYTQFDAIILDDCRDKGEEIPTRQIYSIVKSHNIPVFGNQHGNRDFQGHIYEIDHYKAVFDFCFLFGKWHKNELSNTNNFLIPGGIPANDVLKDYKRTNEYILIIPNYLDTERGPFPVRFGDKFIEQIKLFDLQQKYGKRVIVKLKPRDRHFANGNPYMDDVNYVKSLLAKHNIEGDVIRDTDDDNLMISQAHSVIGISSTLCLKSIQLGIPTVILKGGNFLGMFKDYRGTCEPEYVSSMIDSQIKLGRDIEFINKIIEGGTDYNSTDIYIKQLLERI